MHLKLILKSMDNIKRLDFHKTFMDFLIRNGFVFSKPQFAHTKKGNFHGNTRIRDIVQGL